MHYRENLAKDVLNWDFEDNQVLSEWMNGKKIFKIDEYFFGSSDGEIIMTFFLRLGERLVWPEHRLTSEW